MAIATLNRNAIQNSPGQIFLLAAPTTVVGTTPSAIVKELYGKFYTDGDIRSTLTTTTPWAAIDKAGYKDKITAKEIKVELNDSPEEVIGYEVIDYEADLTIVDVDAQHMKDVLSASAAEVLTTVASATQAGRDTLIGGGQRYPNDYMLLYRFPSKKAPGEFNNILVPICNFTLKTDRENSKSKARELKINIRAKACYLLPDPTTGMPTLWLEDFVTNPKTA